MVNTPVVIPAGLTATGRKASEVWDDGIDLSSWAVVNLCHQIILIICKLWASAHLTICLNAISSGMKCFYLCDFCYWISSGWLSHCFTLRLFFSPCFVFKTWSQTSGANSTQEKKKSLWAPLFLAIWPLTLCDIKQKNIL